MCMILGTLVQKSCADSLNGYAGARDPLDSTFTFDASRPMLPRILEQLRDETSDNAAPNRHLAVPRIEGLTKQATSSCSFGADERPELSEKLSHMHMTADL